MKHKKQTKKTRRPTKYPAPKRQGRAVPRDRLHKAPAMSVAEGVFSGTRGGYGFVDIGEADTDIFIPAPKTGGAIDGDRVEVRYRKRDRYGLRTEGEVTRIVAPGRDTVIGILCREEFYPHGRRGKRSVRYFVDPDQVHISLPLTVRDPQDAKVGDKVEVRLGTRRAGQTDLLCEVVRTFGDAFTREANYEAVLADCGVPVDFSPEALAQAEEAAAIPLSESGRVRREEIIFTIDGADAKDLDDAISLRVKRDGTYLLGVHIADVSHYVTPKTPLDEAVTERGTSLYFTDKVVPMLPVALSNGACSLNAGEDKYALSAIIHLSATGEILSTKLEKSILRSRVRGVYSEVNDLLANGKASAWYEKYREVYPTLTRMERLYRILLANSRARGALELERAEARILLDEAGMPTEIVARERGDAERLIEQFMLIANEGVATLLREQDIPCVYRIHERPNPEKLQEFVSYVHNLGFDTSYIRSADPTGADFGKLLDAAEERGLRGAVSYTLLRAMAKAKYSDQCTPHYGLGIERYCHFTSPIRRLSDLATHRIISAVLLGGEAKNKYRAYAHRAATAATETELRALTAERRIDALYKALYLSKHVGEVWEATVSSVTSFGVFAELDNTCEGMIPLTDLPGGYWTFDEGNCHLRSPFGLIIALGDRIRISIEEADISRGKVRFAYISHVEGTPRKPAPSAPQKAKKKTEPHARKAPKKTDRAKPRNAQKGRRHTK